MSNLTPTASFDDVAQLETTTVALGGAGAPMNVQAQALLNRTQYLYVRLSSLAAVASTGDYNSLINRPALGSAAYQSSSAFATAAQGAKADGAAQASALAAVATSGSYNDLLNLPPIYSGVFTQTPQFEKGWTAGAFGASSYSWYGAYPNSCYLTLSKPTEEDDASFVFCEGGVAQWEMGATTEVVGSENNFHLKRVIAGGTTFEDVLMVDHATGGTWIPAPFQLGIGSIPAPGYPLSVADVSNGHTASRLEVLLQNYNTSGSGSQSSGILFGGNGTSWLLANDYGLNGNDNWFLSAGSGVLSLFGNSNGVIVGASSGYNEPTEVMRFESSGSKGIIPPNLTTAQRDAMGGKNSSLLIYNTDVKSLQWWDANTGLWLAPTVQHATASLVAVDTQNAIGWGDSLTAGLGQVPWPSALSELMGTGAIVNQGVGGDTSTQIKTRFLAATPANFNGVQIIWAGRNNFGDPTTVKSDIAAMVAALSHTRYFVLGILNSADSTEWSGTAFYTDITTLNSDLATTYGAKFIDIRSILVNDGLAMCGITPTTQDTTDIGHDAPPQSLRATGDTLHLNSFGYAVVASVLRSRWPLAYA